MATGSSSSSFTYDVFLSFRGDSRYSFTGNLCRALRHSGIHTFMDYRLLHNGHEIISALEKAIEHSRIFIIVFSQNYASSSYCLNELAYILECVKRKGLLAFPVFYNVDPSHVRHHRGSFGEALAYHEAKFKAKKEGLEHNMEKQLEKWKMALHETANLYGYVFKQGDGYEYDFIKRIVELVSSKINQAILDVTDYPVGLESCSDAFSYDVFVSFRGLDTRNGFTGNLNNALRDRGIHPFIDHEQLQIGEKITAAHEKAIENSKIVIVVLSKNYASSSFCLNELTYILECVMRKRLMVIPVFYHVDPSDVRKQSGSFEKALANHEANFKAKKEGLEHNKEKLKKWRRALTEIAKFGGFDLRQRYEHEFIKKVVEYISLRINRAPLHVADYPVGLEPRVIEVMKLLDVGSNDGVHMIGIHGPRGIGKTTLAITVYNSIADRFEGVCFLKNVRENSYKHGLQHLQSILLSKMVGQKNIKLASVKQGISIIQHRLQQKKVLLILDDVDKLEQLQAIVGEPDWFGPGSRVIITTRDKQLLSSHGVKRTYGVKELNKNDALQLLSWKAFKTEKVDTGYVDVMHRAVTYASDLPLASEVIGSKPFGKSIKEREFAINQYDSVGLESCSGAFSYDVFLSFIGSDTLHGFTGYLYKALHDSGIHTFIDEELQRGEEITPAIVKTIETSRIAIIVVSTNYASSSLFLNELETILDCLERKSLLVLPVLYNVDPSHLQPQKGSYGEASAKHEERFNHNMEKLEKLFGFHIKHGTGYEYEFIGEIVEWVTNKINPAHYTVGLGSRVLEVKKLLDVGCDDGIHMLGIYGVGGVGKSTLAREVYDNLIAEHFDASCFIENVREKSEKHVQNILLSKILGEKDINLISIQEGISMIQSRLQPKKVLLILDDVDRHEQLKAVAGRPVWLGPGSIVIITAQDKQLLASLGVKKTYEVKELSKNDALQFLKWKAFKTQYFDPRYEEVLNRAVTYASGLPLALEIIGSNLFGKSVEEWESSIHQFEKSHDNRIQVILKASFDSLAERERSVFLDIACCFKGYELAEVQDILHAHYDHCIKSYIDVLVGKSLVKLSHGTKPCYDTLTLHDLIEGMGKEINRLESLTEPGKRRRLRLPEDIREVLGYNKGTSKIEIICLDFPIFDEEAIVEWDGKAFQNMQNLKTLIIRNGNFSKGPEYLPNSLRVLEWWRYPSHCLPSDFHPKELSICKLPCSHISTIELTNLSRKCVNLRVLNFSSADV